MIDTVSELPHPAASPAATGTEPGPHTRVRGPCPDLRVDPGLTVDAEAPVGPELAAACQAAGTHPGLLTDEQLLCVVAGAERLERWVSALRTRMLGEFAARHPAGSRAAPPDADPRAISPVSRWLPDQVALVLNTSRDQARGLLAEALRFHQVLPETLAAWETGQIDQRVAAAIAETTSVLDHDTARAVQARILPDAPDTPYRLVRDRLRRAITRADPDGAHRRHDRARADRRMSITRGEEGMAALWLGGTAAQTEASWHCVDRLARSLTADPRTLDQRRVDLAHQLLQGTLTLTDLDTVHTAVRDALTTTSTSSAGGGRSATGTTGAGGVGTTAVPAPTAEPLTPGSLTVEALTEVVTQVLARRPDPNTVIGRRPLIQVVVSLDTLLGADTPAELLGHGPIPATTARALAADGVWRRLVTDPLTGTLLDHGRNTYRPPDALADHVRARDGTCRGPSCTRPIRDLDHHHPWGGPGGHGTTSEANLHGLCQGHHKLKDAPGWHVLTGPDGTLTWISPCGRTQTTHPKDYRPFTDPGPTPDPEPGEPGPDDPTVDDRTADDDVPPF